MKIESINNLVRNEYSEDEFLEFYKLCSKDISPKVYRRMCNINMAYFYTYLKRNNLLDNYINNNKGEQMNV